jgi:hypothetical protein
MGPISRPARTRKKSEVPREFLCSSVSPSRPSAIERMMRNMRRQMVRNQNHQSIGGIPDTNCAAGFAVRTRATNALTN